jgi:hypothetical protein
MLRTTGVLRVGHRAFSKEVALQSKPVDGTMHEVESKRALSPSGVSDYAKRADAALAAERKDYFDMLGDLDAR